MKRIVSALCLSLILGFTLTACSKDVMKSEDVKNAEVNEVSGEIIDQTQAAYDEFSSRDQENVSDGDVLETQEDPNSLITLDNYSDYITIRNMSYLPVHDYEILLWTDSLSNFSYDLSYFSSEIEVILDIYSLDNTITYEDVVIEGAIIMSFESYAVSDNGEGRQGSLYIDGTATGFKYETLEVPFSITLSETGDYYDCSNESLPEGRYVYVDESVHVEYEVYSISGRINR